MKETLWQRLTQGVRRVRQRMDWSRYVAPNWAERIMQVPVTDRFHEKQGRSTGRWILQTDGRRLAVYLKRHYRLPTWRGLLAAVLPDAGWSPALQEWRHLEWARAQGLPVPDTVAAGEYIGPWGRFQSFLAVEELTDMVPLHEAIPEAARLHAPAAFHQWKRGLIAELARLTGELHKRSHFHKDLYLCHFYIPGKFTSALPRWLGQVYVIDLHRLGYHPLAWRWWQIKDLAQLLYSSEVEGVTGRDRMRYWHAYLRQVRRRRLTKVLRWLVLQKWHRYRRHNAKRD